MSFVTLAAFLASGVTSAHAQKVATSLDLPQPGAMVNVSAPFVPVLLKGINVDIKQPFKFDFILDTGNSGLDEDTVRDEAQKLIRYFLASLTIPEKDLWVNLSPYEKDRIINDDLGLTEMGRDMLAQDYILKQITSSLIFPENETGKEFWEKVYAKAHELYGVTDVPTDAFNKVWIVPDKAVVYENGTKVFVLEASMKVMLDTDYLAAEQGAAPEDQGVAKDILREVIVPVLEKEVNEGRNFNQLRQIYYSLILAKWYKDTLKDSVLNRKYSDQRKVQGVDLEDTDIRQKIYAQYLEAFKKGVFNYVKEEQDMYTQELIPRKYFSGGVDYAEKINIKKIFSLPSQGIVGLVGRILRVGGNFDPDKKTEPVKEGAVQDVPQVSKPVSPLEKIKAMQRDNFNKRKNSSILYEGRWVQPFPEVETHATSSKRVWKMVFEAGGYITPQPTDNLNAPGVPFIFLCTNPQMEYARKQVAAAGGQPVVLEFDFKKLQDNGIVVRPGSYSTLPDPDTGEPVRFWSWSGYDETQQKIPLAFLTEKSKVDVILAFARDAREEARSLTSEEIRMIAEALDKGLDKVKRPMDAAEDFSITEKLTTQAFGLFAKPANRLRVPLDIRKKYPALKDYYGVKAVLDRRDGRAYFFDIGKPHKEVVAEKFGGIDNDHFGYELQVIELIDGRYIVTGMAMSSQLLFDQQTTLPKIFEADQQLADAIVIENHVKLTDRMYDLELVKKFPGLRSYDPFDELSLDHYKNKENLEELVDFVIELMDIPWASGRPLNRRFTYDFLSQQFRLILSDAPGELEKYRAAFEEGRVPQGGFDLVLAQKMLNYFGELRQDLNVLMSVNTRPGRALWQERTLKNGMLLTVEQASDLRHYFTGDVMNAIESSLALLLDSPEDADAVVSILNHVYSAGVSGSEDLAQFAVIDLVDLAGRSDDEIIAAVGASLYEAGPLLVLRRAEQLLQKAGPEFEIVSQVLFQHMKQNAGVRSELESFGVAFKEALKNAVIWGNRADENAVVTLKWGMEEREFWIEIMDEGKPFDLEGEEAPPGIDPFFYGGKHGLTALMWRYLSMGSKRLNADGSLGYRVDKGKAIKLEISVDQAEAPAAIDGWVEIEGESYEITKLVSSQEQMNAAREWARGDEFFKTDAWLKSIEQNPPGALLTIRSADGRLLGMTLFHGDDSDIYISPTDERYKAKTYFVSLIEVRRELQGRKLGQALMARVIEESMNDPDVEERFKGSIFLVPNHGERSDRLYASFVRASADVRIKSGVQQPTGLLLPAEAAKGFFSSTAARVVKMALPPQRAGSVTPVLQREAFPGKIERDWGTISLEGKYVVLERGGRKSALRIGAPLMPVSASAQIKLVGIDGKQVFQIYKGGLGQEPVLESEFDMGLPSPVSQVDAAMLRADVSNLVDLEAEDIVELFRPYLKDKDGVLLKEGAMQIKGIENFYKPDKDGDAFAVYGRGWQLAEGLLASIYGGPMDRTFWALLDEALRNAFLWGNLGASGEVITLKWRRGELEGKRKFFVEIIDKGRPYYPDEPQFALFQSDVQAGLFGSRQGLGKMLDYLSPRSKTTQNGRLRMGYDVIDEKGQRIGKGIEFAFDMAEQKAVDGGIDLNSDRLDLQRTGVRSEFDWGMSPSELENVQISGLVPVIIRITPVQDLPALLGASH